MSANAVCHRQYTLCIPPIVLGQRLPIKVGHTDPGQHPLAKASRCTWLFVGGIERGSVCFIIIRSWLCATQSAVRECANTTGHLSFGHAAIRELGNFSSGIFSLTYVPIWPQTLGHFPPSVSMNFTVTCEADALTQLKRTNWRKWQAMKRFQCKSMSL